MKLGVKERPKTAQPPAEAEQTTPAAENPRSVEELRAALNALESELAGIPEQRLAARRAATEASKPEEIERHIKIADDLGRRERVLNVQIHHARRELLLAEIAELRGRRVEIEPRHVASQREVKEAEANLLKAQTALDLAKHKQKGLAGQWRGAEIEAQEKERELQILINNQPEV